MTSATVTESNSERIDDCTCSSVTPIALPLCCQVPKCSTKLTPSTMMQQHYHQQYYQQYYQQQLIMQQQARPASAAVMRTSPAAVNERQQREMSVSEINSTPLNSSSPASTTHNSPTHRYPTSYSAMTTPALLPFNQQQQLPVTQQNHYSCQTIIIQHHHPLPLHSLFHLLLLLQSLLAASL